MLQNKNKFICENDLLLSLSKDTNFLEEKSISDNAQSIIELCRKIKTIEQNLMHF